MSLIEALKEAYVYQLCIDFYSCTITDPEGNEWYWTSEGDDIKNFLNVMKEVIEFREKLEGEE